MRQRTTSSTWKKHLVWIVIMLAIGGCTSPLFRAQSPDAEDLTELPQTESGVRYVADFAVPWQTNHLKIEGVGFVTQLAGTGSDPPPSTLRDQLIKEMQTRNVRSATQALASDDTAMVTIHGYIPPGANKGDTFDIEVRVPKRSETTSLRGGWLMPARMREIQIMENSLHTGHVMALAKGPILVDSLFDTADDNVLESRGRVLSGGIVNKPRQLGLVVRDDHISVRTSSMIGAAINDRFHYFERGVKSGVATPTSDDSIELAVHSGYKNNVRRYLRVISSIALGESPRDRLERLGILERMLLEPTSAEAAALRLEACGQDGLPVLTRGLKSTDPEVRFYAAEALAYLDENIAADVLYEAARDERAFRWRALTALSVMDQFAAQERLIELMNVPSAETRCGAFRALRTRNPLDPLVRGEIMAKEFAYHVVSTTGEPLIHFSRSRRPEMVVFGHGMTIEVPSFLYAGKQILIKRMNDEQFKVSRFRPGKDTEHAVCSTKVDDLVRTVVQLGGGYADILMAMKEAKQKGYLPSRIEMDALPRRGRTYHRDEELATDDAARDSGFHVVNPVPDMFLDRLSGARDRRDGVGQRIELDAPDETPTANGIFARMTSWLSD